MAVITNGSPIIRKPTTMNFAAALEQAMEGKRIRRLEWEDRRIYVAFVDEMLMIYTTANGKLHPLTLSTGDVLGEDWVIAKGG